MSGIRHLDPEIPIVVDVLDWQAVLSLVGTRRQNFTIGKHSNNERPWGGNYVCAEQLLLLRPPFSGTVWIMEIFLLDNVEITSVMWSTVAL